MLTLLFLISFVVLVTYIICSLVVESTPKLNLSKKHVIITGGSQGIGFSAAKKFCKEGSHVTIIARNKTNLLSAVKELESLKVDQNQRINWISADVSDYENLKTELIKLINEIGRVDVLLTCAGLAIPGRFLEQEMEIHERQMKVNYFGTLNAIKIVAPFMKEQKGGRIVVTSSMGGLVGLMGLVGYCGTKFALRGITEALQLELSPYNIYFSLVVPPDTDTPGFKEENKTKPLEAKLIQEGSGIYHPDDVAEVIVDGVKNYRYFIANGFDGFALSVSAAAMAPVHSIGRCILEFICSSIFRIVCLFIRRSWTNIVKAHKK